MTETFAVELLEGWQRAEQLLRHTTMAVIGEGKYEVDRLHHCDAKDWPAASCVGDPPAAAVEAQFN